MNRLRKRDDKGHVCDEACGITRDSDCPARQSEASHLKTKEEVERRKEGERLAGLLRCYWPELEPVLMELSAEEAGRMVAEVVRALLRKEGRR